MTVSVKVVTTANKILNFVQRNPGMADAFLDSVRNSGHPFSSRSLIIASEKESQILAPSAITRIEIDGDKDLSSFLPIAGGTPLTAIQEEKPLPRFITEDFLATRMDFFFEGGDSVALSLSTQRAMNVADRMMRITRIFEQPLITYTLANGGIGLMNPSRMTRVKLDSHLDIFPKGTWQLEPLR